MIERLRHAREATLVTLRDDIRLLKKERILEEAKRLFYERGFRGTSLDAIRLMAEMGAGVAILPSLYALSEARLDRGLNARLIDNPLARREISLIWRDTSPLEASLKELAAPLRSAAAKLLRHE